MGTPAKRSLSLGGAVRVAYPDPSSVAVTAVMRGNRSRDTRPEVLLRSALHRHGLRFRKDYRIRAPSRSCRVDIVFTRPQVAVFVDGCFWHGCREHGRTPKSNTGYWEAKLARNAERDRENDAALTASGWTVVRVWEHEPLQEVVDRIAGVLQARASGATRPRRYDDGADSIPNRASKAPHASTIVNAADRCIETVN